MSRVTRSTARRIMSATLVDAGESVSRPYLGRVEARGPEAYLKQYVEGPSDEPARHTKLRLSRRVRSIAAERSLATDFRVQVCRSRESTIAVEVFMNNAG